MKAPLAIGIPAHGMKCKDHIQGSIEARAASSDKGHGLAQQDLAQNQEEQDTSRQGNERKT